MITVQQAYDFLFQSVLLALTIMALLCLLRAVRGPRVADRVVSVNMICTITLTMICILALYMDQGYLLDVALVYAMLGFLAVVVLCKVYMGVALEKREQHEADKKRLMEYLKNKEREEKNNA